MLVQNISPVNYAGNQSFSGKSKNVEAVVNKAFDKIVEAKSKNLGIILHNVVFPPPDGPTSATVFPASIDRLRFLNTSLSSS